MTLSRRSRWLCVFVMSAVPATACEATDGAFAPRDPSKPDASATTPADAAPGAPLADGASVFPGADAAPSTPSDAAPAGDAATGVDASAEAGLTDGGADTSVPVGSYSIDFANAAIENPLSVGGIWSNNTQGVGGNVAPGNFTNMLVGLASDGATKIAFDSHGGIDYDDSFAFVPGFSGDQYAEAVLYKEAGYNPNANGSNHEVELILGCSSGAGTRTWNEFLLNSGGGIDILYLTGGPSGFTSIANVTGAGGVVPKDGDVFRATRVGNVLSFYLNGVLLIGYDGSNPAMVAKGSGIGIAGFIRPGATHNKFGFRRITMGSL